VNDSEPVLEVARRIDLRSESGYAWLAVIPSGEAGENSLVDVKDELEVVLDKPIRTVSAGTGAVHDFISAIQRNSGDTVLLSGLDDWDEANWRSLDIQRSALERPGTIILMLSPNSVLRLSSYAPNIRSFVGGSFIQLAPEGGILSEQERRLRIQALEDHYGLTSEQVIEMAKAGKLDPGPIFVEWLVLIGRGDLV
jgi:hypothetical protein